jgi:hypothetical protein
MEERGTKESIKNVDSRLFHGMYDVYTKYSLKVIMKAVSVMNRKDTKVIILFLLLLYTINTAHEYAVNARLKSLNSTSIF